MNCERKANRSDIEIDNIIIEVITIKHFFPLKNFWAGQFVVVYQTISFFSLSLSSFRFFFLIRRCALAGVLSDVSAWVPFVSPLLKIHYELF